jgi:hypothetical protein
VTTDFLNAQLPIAAATTAGQYLRTLTAGSHHFVSPLCNLHLFGIGATGHIQNVRGSYAQNRLLHYYTVDSFDILSGTFLGRYVERRLLYCYFTILARILLTHSNYFLRLRRNSKRRLLYYYYSRCRAQGNRILLLAFLPAQISVWNFLRS